MKKNVFKILMLTVLLTSLFCSALIAQEDYNDDVFETETVEETETMEETEKPIEEAPELGKIELLARNIVGSGFVDVFISGGFAMWPILFLAIWGLAVIIWRLVALSYARVNVEKLMNEVLPLVKQKKYKEASEYCTNMRGPVASVLAQGLMKADSGLNEMEKTIESASALELSYLDKGFNALSTTISLSPMFGFFGTLVGMISAFDAIAKAGEVSPTIVASGIKVALVTSAAGLAVAIPVQFFYNTFQTMVDSLVIDIQVGSEHLVENYIDSRGE